MSTSKLTRRNFFQSSMAGVTCSIAQLSHAQSSSSRHDNPRPNIVWIWSDNLAYQDVGIYGNQEINTPVINRLASEGIRLTQYYIAHTVCSPSRAALLTGRQPFRVGIVDVLRPDSPSGIPDDEITLAEALKGVGYATAAFGKWHLGDRREHLPTQHGFDFYFGLPYSMDMLPTILYRNNEIINELSGDKVQTVTERMTDKAIHFINDNKENPFFLYFSHTLPHPPINLPPENRTPGRPIYQDAIEYMDMQTGRILEALEKCGLSDNTLVIFSSDNGPMLRDGNTGGLRGRIRDSYEGGIRVPFIARWPGKIPAGTVSDTPAIAYDIFPTFIHLAGGHLPDDRVYDGQNIWPILSGENTVARKEPFFWVYLDNVTSMRDGKWKFHVARRDKTLEIPELYDLEDDPYEKHPVNDHYPDIVKKMTQQVQEFQQQIPHVWTLKYPVRDPQKRESGIRRK